MLGYRQNSSMLRRQLEVSEYDVGASPPESPLPLRLPLLRHAASIRAEAEFAAVAADPLCGFPDAESRIPGYLLGPVVGRGGFCTVRKALHLATSLPAAIKVIEKARLADPKDRDRVDREMRVMRQLSGHVGIVQLLECAETERYVYIAMEYCSGGSLLDHVRDTRRVAEPAAAGLLQQMVRALQHCHSRGVVHRDIKLENVLLDERGGVRLVDFGLAGYFLPGRPLRCHCGSPSYAAPEIVGHKNYQGPPVDVWSLGVVLFGMLLGCLPFHGRDKSELTEKILAGEYRVPAWVSPAAADLVDRMLTANPDDRITLEEVWEHPWVASAPAWEPQGQGGGGLVRARTDPVSGAPLPDAELVRECEARGVDVAALLRSLRARESSPLTATYHLLAQAKAAEVAAAGPAVPTGRAPSSMGDAPTMSASVSSRSCESRSSSSASSAATTMVAAVGGGGQD